MKELASLLQDLGCQNVKTYVQSGNAVFLSKEEDAKRFSKRIGAEIKKCHGFEPGVLLLKPEDIERAIRKNPFPRAEKDPRALHLGFLSSVPKKPDLTKLKSLKKESERFLLISNVFYLHAPEGVGKSKLAANTERLLGVPMTDRNWRTVCTIAEMAKDLR